MTAGRAEVRLQGDLDVETAPRAKQAILQAIDANAGAVVTVSLEDLTFIDSSGLGLLVGALKRARTTGGDLRFLPPPERLWRAFTVTGLDRALPFTRLSA